MKKNREPQRDYTREELHKEREFGPFWYSWLWHILRPVLIALCVVLIVTGVVMGAVNYVNRSFFAPVNESDTESVVFEVAGGSSLTRVANNLESQNLIRNRSVFKYYADFLGYGQKIQSGEYVLSRSMDMKEILNTLTTGDGKPIVRTITIIPGWTVENIADYLVAQGALTDSAEFLSLCKTGTDYTGYYYVSDVLASKNVSKRHYALEGYLAANTYEIYTSATADEIVRKLLSQTGAVFTDSYYDRAQELGFTMDQIMTLASMIEKEAVTSDFAKVSAVFHNRLKKNMSLGSDVTVKYVTGVKRMSLTNQDMAVDSLYNTYKYKGLPLGPICSPSPAAILAALYPEESFMVKGQEYLYFCSKDPATSELHFSQTYEEHQQAVAIYQPLWQAYDKEQGN